MQSRSQRTFPSWCGTRVGGMEKRETPIETSVGSSKCRPLAMYASDSMGELDVTE